MTDLTELEHTANEEDRHGNREALEAAHARIAELEAERDSYRHDCNRLAERVMKNETRIAELEDKVAEYEHRLGLWKR